MNAANIADPTKGSSRGDPKLATPQVIETLSPTTL
jgi:hypothetical protein